MRNNDVWELASGMGSPRLEEFSALGPGIMNPRSYLALGLTMHPNDLLLLGRGLLNGDKALYKELPEGYCRGLYKGV